MNGSESSSSLRDEGHSTEVFIGTSKNGHMVGGRSLSSSDTFNGRWQNCSNITLLGKRIVSSTDTRVRLGRRNDDNITSSSSTSSSTKLTDNHVHHSILDKGLVFSSFEENQTIISMGESPTFTAIRTPRPTLNGSVGVDNNFDLVTTSGFEERSHFEGVETVVLSERLSSSSNVDLHTSSKSVFTVVFGEGVRGILSRPRVNGETVFNNHGSIILGTTRGDLDVEMHVHLESSGGRTRGGHDPEDIAEFLVSRTEGTSSSDGGEMSRRKCKSTVENNTGNSLEFTGIKFLDRVSNQTLIVLGEKSELSGSRRDLSIRLITWVTTISSSTTSTFTTTVTTPLSLEESELHLLSRSTGGHS
jgi:hypothetical protein